jgi:hypothetical protein
MKAGLYYDFDAATYHNDPCDGPSLNYSTAKEFILRSAWHAKSKNPRLGGERWTPSRKMDEGSIVHALLLEQPLDGLIEVIDAEDFRKGATKDKRKKAQDEGKLVILEKRFVELKAGVPYMLDNLAEAGVDLDGHREATVVWDLDCMCRTRIDRLSTDHLSIVDLKCSDDPNPAFLERHIVDMCYDVQAAAEIEAIETTLPETTGRIKFEDVFIWTSEPWFVIAVEHSESLLDLGQRRWARAKSMWTECLRTNTWKGYASRMIGHAPTWAINKEYGDRV